MVDVLHIPDHIRFECSGCGNCCLQWPVPATQADVVRIEELANSRSATHGAAATFRRMNAGDQRFRGFTHTLEKRSDGRCEFLSEDNRCKLHSEHGADTKPSMCQLFPHAFAMTPSGAFAYVSFASTGVLYNQGRLLSEQRELLEERFALYRKLFPNVIPDWSTIQVIDGVPLAWDEFLSIEKQLLAAVADAKLATALDKLEACSHIVKSALSPAVTPEQMPRVEAHPSIVDQIILKHLGKTYLPPDVFSEDQFDVDTNALMMQIVEAPLTVSLGEKSFEQLSQITLGPLDDDIEDLFNRFVYARMFAKLYFGPSLAHLSLLAGIHHLYFVIAIARLNLKLAKAAGRDIDFVTAAEVIRTIERRLSQMNFSARSSAVLEVLLSGPSRLPRIRQLSS